MRTALIQLNSSDDPKENLQDIQSYIETAAQDGAKFVLTPEVSNCISGSRAHQQSVLCSEDDDSTLPALRSLAREKDIWLLVGSLGLKVDDPDGRFANRSFLISPEGDIHTRYDKIHMFDVQVTPEETYRESDGYRPGNKAVVAETSFGKIGLSICYDLRFPYLYRALAQAGASIITVPAAFSYVTGKAHWHSLLQARAIETGCFVLAPAQTGTHRASIGKSRRTFGHSLAISPWGEILLDAGSDPGVYSFNIDLSAVSEARRKIPSLSHTRAFEGP